MVQGLAVVVVEEPAVQEQEEVVGGQITTDSLGERGLVFVPCLKGDSDR